MGVMKNLIPILLITVVLSSGCGMIPPMVLQRTNDYGQVYNVDAYWWATSKEAGKAFMTVGAFVILF